MSKKRTISLIGLAKKALPALFIVVSVSSVPVRPAFADLTKLSDDRGLILFNLHSREKVEIDYCSDGVYVPHALAIIDRLLRDPLNGEVKPIDPKLLDLLFALHTKVGAEAPFTVVCGYRSPQTNKALRARNRAVAEHSLHMEGKAVDIKIPGVPLDKLYKAALELTAGGVGYYPRSGFIHVDVGPVRTW
jgi:uncharacterized protein YcbK (DUF882 family)